MKTKTKKPIKKTASEVNEMEARPHIMKKRNSLYQFSEGSSSPKVRIGELLFHLQKPLKAYEREVLWQGFEVLLREYVGYKQ